jgi:hypothetical protein
MIPKSSNTLFMLTADGDLLFAGQGHAHSPCLLAPSEPKPSRGIASCIGTRASATARAAFERVNIGGNQHEFGSRPSICRNMNERSSGMRTFWQKRVD